MYLCACECVCVWWWRTVSYLSASCAFVQRGTVCCSVLQHVAVCCSVLREHLSASCAFPLHTNWQNIRSVLQRGAVCCSVLQHVAVCCSVLHEYLSASCAFHFRTKAAPTHTSVTRECRTGKIRLQYHTPSLRPDIESQSR